MDKIKIIEVKESVFANNDERAEKLRDELRATGSFLLNVMSSPGSGKTTFLTRLIKDIEDEYKIAVMEADIDGDVDAHRILNETKAEAIQLHTGGMCHLDADMVREGLDEIDPGRFDLIFLENVGNLVCPAEFDTGASMNGVILSVPEGDDKPLKYPLMFQEADVVFVSKIDVLPYFDFDLEKFKKNLQDRNPDCQVIPVSAVTGEGMEDVKAWLKKAINNWRGV